MLPVIAPESFPSALRSKKSDRWIAEKCGVSDRTVNRTREEMNCDIVAVDGERTGQDGKTRKLPVKRDPAPEAPPVEPRPALERGTVDLCLTRRTFSVQRSTVIQEDRTERFAVRLSTSELTMLNELAEEAGLSAADIVRTLIRREHVAKFGKRKP